MRVRLYHRVLQLMAKEHYVSPTFVEHLKKPKSNKRDILTEQEQMILSVIGDGTDNLEAGEKLALSKHTIHSHRKSIMGKLRLHHRGDLGYMLPDVLTTKAWLRHVDLYFAKLFDGFRQDSGDPHVWSQLIIDHLNSLGIDPASKFAVYSDTLNVDSMLALWKRYEGNPWKTSYLIGTFLTNNVPGHKALSQVIKLSAVNGQSVAKISDEPIKATCENMEFIANLKKTFDIA